MEVTQTMWEGALINGGVALRQTAKKHEKVAEYDHVIGEKRYKHLRIAAERRRDAEILDMLLHNDV